MDTNMQRHSSPSKINLRTPASRITPIPTPKRALHFQTPSDAATSVGSTGSITSGGHNGNEGAASTNRKPKVRTVKSRFLETKAAPTPSVATKPSKSKNTQGDTVQRQPRHLSSRERIRGSGKQQTITTPGPGSQPSSVEPVGQLDRKAQLAAYRASKSTGTVSKPPRPHPSQHPVATPMPGLRCPSELAASASRNPARSVRQSTPPDASRPSSAPAAALKGDIPNDIHSTLQLQAWEEQQWRHLLTRSRYSLDQRKLRAQESLSQASALLSAVRNEVVNMTQQVEKNRAASQMHTVVSSQLPALVRLMESRAAAAHAIKSTTDAFESTKLHVPLTDGASVAGRGQSLSNAEALQMALRSSLQAVDEQHRLLSTALAGPAPSQADSDDEDDQLDKLANTEHKRHGIALVGDASKELCQTALKEIDMLAKTALMLRQLDDVQMQEQSLRAHMLQIRRLHGL